MASVTVTSKGQECIASGVVLADVSEPFEITIADGDERLILCCSFIDDQADPERGRGEPGVSFQSVDAQTAQIVFANIRREHDLTINFGPLAIATFKQRGLSLIFHVRLASPTVEMLYSFWLRND